VTSPSRKSTPCSANLLIERVVVAGSRSPTTSIGFIPQRCIVSRRSISVTRWDDSRLSRTTKAVRAPPKPPPRITTLLDAIALSQISSLTIPKDFWLNRISPEQHYRICDEGACLGTR